MKREEEYKGFEDGPIRPPSEADSLLLRVTRNCPWNKCKFCSLYKGEKFSVRPVDHVIRDIDLVKRLCDEIHSALHLPDEQKRKKLNDLQAPLDENEWMAFQSAKNWVRDGMRSIFLQDANSLIIKPDYLVNILEYLIETFPQVERITSYARSSSIARTSDDDMARIANAGLNRIHIGMESASDEVLDFVRKGVGKDTHIIAGQKIKRAGIELSEYYMPGLGGERLSKANALETADALNRIDPDFIRIRTLVIPHGTELFTDMQTGRFKKTGDIETARELLLFLDALEGITSTVKSDHIINLFEEVEGRLPEDKDYMKAPIKEFLDMDPLLQVLYITGRRTGSFRRLDDMKDPIRYKRAENTRVSRNLTVHNVDDFTAGIVTRYI
ncbi:MAG: radical SAM protein [Nitrospirota bacterium]|nr:MAG: radical SAM protein [Nitrospirota bacterium]